MPLQALVILVAASLGFVATVTVLARLTQLAVAAVPRGNR